MSNDNSNNISRTEKLLSLKMTINAVIDDDTLNQLYKKFILDTKDAKKDNDKTDNRLQKGDAKYDLLLEFLNAILSRLNMEQITDITYFKNIKRDDIVSDKCKNIVDIYLERIVDVKMYGKTNMYYSTREDRQYYILTLIRQMAKQCGYELNMVPKVEYIKIGVERCRERKAYRTVEIV